VASVRWKRFQHRLLPYKEMVGVGIGLLWVCLCPTSFFLNMWPIFNKIATSILSVGAQPDFVLAALSNNISNVRTRIEIRSRQCKFCLGETHHSVIARTGYFYRFSKKTPTLCCRVTDRICRKTCYWRPTSSKSSSKQNRIFLHF